MQAMHNLNCDGTQSATFVVLKIDGASSLSLSSSMRVLLSSWA